MENRMKKKYKLLLCILVICIIVIIGLLVVKNKGEKTPKNDVKVIDSIVDFSYTLDERDSNLMKDTYKNLKKVLSSKDIDYEEYSKIIAELFIIDLFTLDNKINKYDVASLEYVYPDNLDNFKLNVQDTLYKNIDDNTYGKRVEKLPIVSSIEVLDVKQSTFKLKDEDVNSYVVSLKWSYEQDLGYDKEGIVTLVKNDKNVYVVEYKAGAVNE